MRGDRREHSYITLRINWVVNGSYLLRLLYAAGVMFCFAGIAGGVVVSGSPIPPSAEGDTTSYNRMLGRGINLGNTLDAPFEGAWGVTLKSDYFQAIADAGFNSVRIPIRWSAHALNDPPYTIDGTFFQRVDWTIDQALTRNLKVVIDLHHYGEMNQDPTANRARLLSLWRQIAVRYRDRPQSLYFELFNEPQDKFTDQDWNDVLAQLLKEVREYDSKRAIIVGPGYWNGFDHLPELQLPSDDRRLIVTFHYYRPFQFTHQAQAWLPASQAWRGTHWGNEQDKRALHDDFVSVAAWAKEHQRPIYLGEFGASENAEMDDRLAWTRAVVANANTMGFSWSYWQFTTSFGAYDTITNSWNERMLHALLN